MVVMDTKPVGARVSSWTTVIISLVSTLLLIVSIVLPSAAVHSDNEDSEDEAIRYRQSTPTDAITTLQKQIDEGKVRLSPSGRQGVLQSLLSQLHIPIESQILVFSKTSFQRELISPTNPRALYFNDNTYIGWVQGSSVIEAAAMDPKLGMVFYTADQDKSGKLTFKRGTDECLQCHETAMSNKVPGNIFRSVYTHLDGQPEYSAGTYLTDETSPMEERWGGWYVTGKHGGIRHMGNSLVHGGRDNITFDRNVGANISSLARYFETSHYLAPTSDIASLMVAEHQTHIQNLLVRANYQTRIAERYDEALNKDLNRPAGYHSDSMRSRIVSVCEPLVRSLLFAEEPALQSPISPSNWFARKFEQEGPMMSRGRSLRQLDLKTRLMKYRCSYMIYSEAFRTLPDRARNYVYSRLVEILTGKDSSKPFESITASPEERSAILEILTDTLPEFASKLASPQ